MDWFFNQINLNFFNSVNGPWFREKPLTQLTHDNSKKTLIASTLAWDKRLKRPKVHLPMSLCAWCHTRLDSVFLVTVLRATIIAVSPIWSYCMGWYRFRSGDVLQAKEEWIFAMSQSGIFSSLPKTLKVSKLCFWYNT